MSIQRLSSANPYNQTVTDIDSNTVELNGKISQAQFNKNEIDAFYSDLGLSRKFRLLSGAGHSLATYTNWSHLRAESGFSIWKIPYTNFQDNTLNEMYLDDILLTYKGKASQEDFSAFTKVWDYDGVTYIDGTSNASQEGGTAQAFLDDTSHYLYCGLTATFSAIDFDFGVKGSNYTLKFEYWNGSAWTTLSTTTDALVDNTNNFRSNGRVEFTIPVTWTQYNVNGSTLYYIRISTTTTPVTVVTAYSIFPGSSAYSLLQLSSTNVLSEQWAWCYFNGNIYVTMRNIGPSSYEGNTYVSSSSSVANKQNYFVYNHEYKISYEQTSYTTGAMSTPVYGFRWYNTGSSINIINWSNTTPFRITNTRSSALAMRIDAGVNDLVTGASAGTGGSAPAQIAKYLAISVDGTTYKIPCYDT